MPKLSYETIQKQIARLQTQAKAIEAARGASKAKSVAKVRALMKKLGVEVADLNAAPAARRGRPAKAGAKREKSAAGGARAPVAPKYRDPATGVTWTGRGRTPVWMAAQLAQGKSKEDFAISAGDSK
jgi:DNA-binding protein H-NS